MTFEQLAHPPHPNITVALDADPESLDVYEQLSGGILQFAHMSYDPLVRPDQGYEVRRPFGRELKQLDAKTVRFHLRKGVKFHTGNPFTADDVIWTYNRILKSEDLQRAVWR